MKIFTPINELEATLISAKNGEISMRDFLTKLAKADLALPTPTEVKEDGSEFTPVFFDRGETKMLAAFSDILRCTQLASLAKYSLCMPALEVLKRIPAQVGLVINPGLSVGLEISPQGIEEIIKDASL